MAQIRIIDEANQKDINIANEPFALVGRLVVSYVGEKWDYTIERSSALSEMCFPDENYDFAKMKDDCVFLGAYEQSQCIGLAILQKGFFKYMYLYDLKVAKARRGQGVAKKMLEKAKEIAARNGYRGIYTIGQNNNLGACLFYLKNGFQIGGLDTQVYKGTNQEGKEDIYFYLDC